MFKIISLLKRDLSKYFFLSNNLVIYNKSDFAKPLLGLKSLWIWKFIYIYGKNYQDISFKIYNLIKIITYEILVRMKRKRDWLYLQDIHFKIYSNEEKKLLLKRKYSDTKKIRDYQNWKKSQESLKRKNSVFMERYYYHYYMERLICIIIIIKKIENYIWFQLEKNKVDRNKYLVFITYIILHVQCIIYIILSNTNLNLI